MKPRGAVVAALLIVLVLSALYPVRQYFAQAAHSRSLAAQQRTLESKIASLGATRNSLLTDAEVERIAREDLGMVRPGEVAFAIVPGAKPAPAPAAKPAAKKPVAAPAQATAKQSAGAPWYERWWNGFIDGFTGRN